MLEQHEDASLDREQHKRNVTISDELKTLIANWYICPYEDDIEEFFDCFEYATYAYIQKSPLNHIDIIHIIKDLRLHLNPHHNRNLYYFCDIICDHILLKNKALTKNEFDDFKAFILLCKDYVYDKL